MQGTLTDKAIRVAISRGKAAKLFDGGGLYLLIQPPKPAYWRHKYRYAGSEKLISHGVYPRVSLKLARKRWSDARDLLEAGINPSAKRQEDKAAKRSAAQNNFKAIGEEWYGKRAKAWASSNADKIAGRLAKDIYPWIGSTPIAELTREQILTCLRRVEDRGAIDTARRERQYIDKIFEYAMQVSVAKVNPTPRAGAIATPKEGKFASITDPRGVGGLIRAIRSCQGSLVTRIALQLAPLLFVRPGELRAAEWTEFDLDAAEWRIPAARMKMKILHLVPLSSQAVTLLRELKPLTGRGRYLFPSERSPLRPMSANTLTAAIRTLGYAKSQMTVHGFRHMASTLLNENGWKPDAIERQLAHMPRDAVRATYNAAQYLPERRKMMQWWADHLDALAAADGRVVDIREARK